MKSHMKAAMISAAVMMAAGMDSGYQPTRRTKPKRQRSPHEDAHNINRAKDRRNKRRAKRLEVRNKNS